MISIIVLVPILVILTIGTRIMQLRDQRHAKSVESREEDQGAREPGESSDSKDEGAKI
jgi:hypothetical protein